MVLVSLSLVLLLAAASFTLSVLGLIQAAAWAGIPLELRWLVPIVVDSTILVYAVAASVQRARGESTALSWAAVGFFTLVSVVANAAHVLAPGGVPQNLDGPVLFGACLAAIMPVSLFFATETTARLAVAPVYGSVASRRRRAQKKMDQMDQSRTAKRTTGKDQWTTSGGPLADHPDGPGMDHRKGPLVDQRKDHLRTTPKKRPEVDPKAIRNLADSGLSQRAIAQQLGVSKTTVARVLSDQQDGELQPVGG